MQKALTPSGVPLPETSLLIHGSVNAVIDRCGAKGPLVTAERCGDVYEVDRVNRK